MNALKRGIPVLALLFVTSAITACDTTDPAESAPQIIYVGGQGATNMNQQDLADALSAYNLEPLSDAEKEGILFMREEEKLARDVYAALYEAWGVPIFSNIASSEATHTEAIRLLIERYDLMDPMTTDEAGVFANADLQALYDALVDEGSASREAAMRVGQAIEEIDILDLEEQVAEVVDNADIAMVYANLTKGSRNHLRSFTSQLASMGADVEAMYLDDAAFEAIISSPMERGR